MGPSSSIILAINKMREFKGCVQPAARANVLGITLSPRSIEADAI